MNNTMNVFQRMNAVMSEVSYLMKDGTVETGGGKSYRAITDAKVRRAINPALVKYGLVIVPISVRSKREDERVLAYDRYQKKEIERINRVTTIEASYRIQNIDDKDDFIVVEGAGTGVDTQDKGIGKAQTYAYKYMILNSFGIATGEDTDDISSEMYTNKLTGAPERPTQNPTNEEFMSGIKKNEYIDTINELCTDDEIQKLCDQKKVKELHDMTETQLEKILKLLEKRGAENA